MKVNNKIKIEDLQKVNDIYHFDEERHEGMLSSVYLVALFLPMSGLCVLRNCKEAPTGTSGLFLTLGKTPDHSSPSL